MHGIYPRACIRCRCGCGGGGGGGGTLSVSRSLPDEQHPERLQVCNHVLAELVQRVLEFFLEFRGAGELRLELQARDSVLEVRTFGVRHAQRGGEEEPREHVNAVVVRVDSSCFWCKVPRRTDGVDCHASRSLRWHDDARSPVGQHDARGRGDARGRRLAIICRVRGGRDDEHVLRLEVAPDDSIFLESAQVVRDLFCEFDGLWQVELNVREVVHEAPSVASLHEHAHAVRRVFLTFGG
mmetsp:Transcript_6752/g.17549  ORF Transcript_6752/g.17549 Transcript_6752/m.17549 type:complete len:239 (+) Transcript_6752:257-973(+)